MNAYEAQLARIDNSSMPYGTREQREWFFRSLLPKAVYITDEMKEKGLPGFCIRQGKHINVKQECTRCEQCEQKNQRTGNIQPVCRRWYRYRTWNIQGSFRKV